MNNTKETSLLFCILMDAIGYFTYAIPVLGEFGDIIWAPVSAFVFYKTFGGWKGVVGGLFDFTEEILLGTDFIPSFTLMWLWQKITSKKQNTTIVKTV
ncbi:MAG: hypothetical protein HYR66_17900 [Sphingobacteriales bacterium]|nr:hypothetical protein [Sphingobacteriales bacterium]MBI3720066.1 hypothetical protein [Sphingobacteriales bacterium]